MASLASAFRLARAAWRLARADALVPREIDALLEPWPRALARLARTAAGPEARRGRPGERLARALEREGPVAIKLGQFLATRADVFGAAFAEDLGRLQDRLSPVADDEARNAVERALGAPIAALFADFGPPAAAASLAQVHPAVLLDGRKAAVKVLRPGIETRVDADIRALALAARIAERRVPGAARLAPRAFAATIARALRLELDLRFEAAGADELRLAMAADRFMSAPAVVWDRVAKRVLTLTWAPGAPLSGRDSLDRAEVDRPRLAVDLVRGFLAQALDHGVFHADLHEGNLFVDDRGRLVAVDFGIVGRLGPRERRYLAEILWGFLNRDYERVARVHFTAGYVPASHDPAAFAQALRAVGEPIFGLEAAKVSMTRLLAQLFDVTGLFDMRLRPELVLLQKTMVTIEGVGRRIDPALDIWAAAEPIVKRWIIRELSPAKRAARLARETRAVLEALAAPRRGDPGQGASGGAEAAQAPDQVKRARAVDPKSFALGVLAAALLASALALALLR